jgi:hypothetical protein
VQFPQQGFEVVDGRVQEDGAQNAGTAPAVLRTAGVQDEIRQVQPDRVFFFERGRFLIPLLGDGDWQAMVFTWQISSRERSTQEERSVRFPLPPCGPRRRQEPDSTRRSFDAACVW